MSELIAKVELLEREEEETWNGRPTKNKFDRNIRHPVHY
jgi:hypothetical protein